MKTNRVPALVRLTPGGCHVDFLPHGNVTRSCLSGYESPENFFEKNPARDFEGVPFLISTHLDGTPAIIEGGFSGPMLDVSLPQGHMRPCLGESRPLNPSEKPGPLDYVATDLYLSMWQRLGAITGIIRKGKFVSKTAA
jgi:hypothetical protein